MIKFVFVVKVDALPGQFAVDVFVEVFELLNDASQTEGELFRNIRRLLILVKHGVDAVKEILDIFFFGCKFFLYDFHLLLFWRSDLLFPLNWNGIEIIEFRQVLEDHLPFVLRMDVND